MTQYWMFISDDETWLSLIRSGACQLSDRHARTARKIRKGDLGVAYVKFFSAIYGIIRMTSESYELKNAEYPVRINIEPVTFLKEPASIRELIRQLSFIKNKQRWYSYFQTSLRKIPKVDFDLIKKYVTNNKVATSK